MHRTIIGLLTIPNPLKLGSWKASSILQHIHDKEEQELLQTLALISRVQLLKELYFFHVHTLIRYTLWNCHGNAAETRLRPRDWKGKN